MIQKIKIKNLEDKNKEISELKESALQIKNEILELNKEKESLEKNMRSAGDIEKKYLEERSLLLKLQSAERDLDIKFVRLKEQEKSAQEMIISIKSEISRKEDIKRKIKEMEAIASWLEDYFQNLVLTMEKHVMAGIYHEFNDLVTKWFSSLIGDETLSLRLDSEFTPTLEQNGYETSIQNLSGGEKTAVALAYRLSLNKVINSMINTISTKDIIILDEPTDGFSTEQLDRVKEVIDELSLSQVIIVSHEPKIEGFVDSIIRIEKNGHESKVVYG